MSEPDERKHKRNVDAPSAVYAVARLAEAALHRDVENLKSIGGEHPEVQMLREQCKDNDVVTSSSACHALVALVEAGVLTIPNVMSTLIAILPYCASHVGITSAIGQLLVLDLKMKSENQRKYKSPFNLQSPQHPFLTILKQNKNSWHHVINQIAFLCSHPEKIVRDNKSELLRPVILYMMCDPGSESSLVYRQQLWTILLSGRDCSLLETCLPWLQINDIRSVQALYIQLASAMKLHNFENTGHLTTHNMILELSGIGYTSILKGEDPRPILNAITDFLLDDCCTFTGSCLAMVLAHIITKTSAIYLSSLVNFCDKLIQRKLCVLLAGKMVIASLLPWLARPSILTAEACKDVNKLLNTINNLSSVCMDKSPDFYLSSAICHYCVQTCGIINTWSGDPVLILQWLSSVSASPIKSDMHLLLGALVIYHDAPVVLSECLTVLTLVTNERSELGTSILTWLLYRLAREKHPLNQLELLKVIPLMGNQKENVALVIHTLESLKNSSLEHKPLILNLYFQLWKREPRCFLYIHKLLAETLMESGIVTKLQIMNWNLTKTVIMKDICEIRPKQHGSQLVPLLSNILNVCMSDEGAITSSLALQAICALCRAKVVNVATTWKALAPRLSNDKRIPVIKSLCEILGLISDSRSGDDQAKLFADAQTKLWNYIVNHSSVEVKAAALQALGQFSLDKLKLKLIPECFRENLKLPPEYSKTPIDAARKPENVLPYIPGECWPQLLEKLPIAENLVQQLLSNEVLAFRGALHRQPGKAEPVVPSLPRDSVCVGLIAYLRERKHSPTAAFVPILRILSSPLPQVLPPCDWSFLVDVSKKEELQNWCLKVAASQAHLSPSAHKVAEELVHSLAVQVSPELKADHLAVFTMLTLLCNAVSPNTLRQFIENKVEASIKAIQRDHTLFTTLMGHVKSALKSDKIHEANRMLLCVLLEEQLEKLSIEDEEAFKSYVDCVAELSTKYLERMCSPSVWWEITPDKLEKAIIIRGHIAVNGDVESPLVWMNECIDATATRPRQQEFLLEQLQDVVLQNKDNVSCKDWVLQLMGHMQASLTSAEKEAQVSFFCDIFSLAILLLSGHNCLSSNPCIIFRDRNLRLTLLPQALSALLKSTAWLHITGQVVEWLHHLLKSSVISSEIRESLIKCLQALRNSQPMQQPNIWQRVVSY